MAKRLSTIATTIVVSMLCYAPMALSQEPFYSGVGGATEFLALRGIFRYLRIDLPCSGSFHISRERELRGLHLPDVGWLLLFPPLIAETSEKAEQPVQHGKRVGRAARNIKIDGNVLGHASLRSICAGEGTAADGACSDGDDDFGSRNRGVGFTQRVLHISRHRAGDDDAIGVARRGDELNSESPQIEDDIAERDELGLAAVAASGRHLPQFERAPEELFHRWVEGPRELDLFVSDDQVIATSRRQAMIAGVANSALRARLLA